MRPDFLEGLEILETLDFIATLVVLSWAARQGGVLAAVRGRVGCWLLCAAGWGAGCCAWWGVLIGVVKCWLFWAV